MNIWQILEIDPTQDLQAIKAAYAKKLKSCKPEIDPDGFQQLRTAYETAQKHAHGIETATEAEGNAADTRDPINLAYHVLDKIQNNQDEAIALVEQLDKNGDLDNIEYSNKFQQTLAINLLSMTPGYYRFSCFALDFFKWKDQLNSESDSFFKVAIVNLVNQTRPIRFLQYLYFLGTIKDKKKAREEKVDWNECCAAKILMNPPHRFIYPSEQILKAIKHLLKEAFTNYPLAIGLGMNIDSVNKWSKYGERKISLRIPQWLGLIWIVGVIVANLFTHEQEIIHPARVQPTHEYRSNTVTTTTIPKIKKPPLFDGNYKKNNEDYLNSLLTR